MSAHFAESTLTFIAPRTTAAVSGTRRSPSLLQRMAQWLVDMPRRRAVINELDALSDHELADIGLARVDVPRVFDAGFTGRRTAS